MTENVDAAKDNALVLVPIRNKQRIQKNDLCFPSHSTISLQHNGLIGRPQLLSCLYAACGCDENKMIGSSKNKCYKCQETTSALGSYVSRETLEVMANNTIRCRGGKNASVSVNSVPYSSNESWSEEILLRSGMVVSFSTNFEHEKPSIKLSFEVVPCPTLLAPHEKSLRGLNASTKKRPLEQSAFALQPNRATKTSYPTNGNKKNCHRPSFGHQPSDPLPIPDAPSCTRCSSSCAKEAKESHHSVSKPPIPKRQCEKDLSIPTLLEQASSGPFVNPKKDAADSQVKTRTGGSAAIKISARPDLNEVEHPFEKQRCRKVSNIATSVATEKHLTTPTADGFESSGDNFQPRLFFCPLGQDMSKGLIRTLSNRVEELGAIVVGKLDLASHLIVSSSVSSWEKVANRLKLNETELLSLLSSKDIKAITPRWIKAMAAEENLRKPVSSETWRLVTIAGAEKKRSSDLPSRHDDKKEKREFATNREVSKIFRELGELYQDCPLEENDMWRAYQFRINAGRVKLLPFELSLDNLGRLRKDVTGFGDSCIEIVRQHLEYGHVERIHKLKIDKRRTAMRNMMEIWGVGKQAALRLINDGCSSIEDVRRRLANNTLRLERNQLVGVECYEDIMERMSRPEVEQIGEIIKAHVLKLFPSAEVEVMGSYRRGKDSCGDVDVHLTSNDYRTRIPPDALGSIVDSLWRDGHIAFHLTFLYGMETGYELHDFQQSAKNLEPVVWETCKHLRLPPKTNGEKNHSTYMGVFNSPMVKGIRRRVDLKFYAYRERIFASLYFTGNGFFNRSMRLWARQKGWQLNDSGLFNRATMKRILDATEERVVFDMLGLVYKNPHERDSFDALEPKTGEVVDYEPTQGELKDYQDNKWIE